VVIALQGLTFCSRSSLLSETGPPSTGEDAPGAGVDIPPDASGPVVDATTAVHPVPYLPVRIITTGDSIVAQGSFQYWLWLGYGVPDGGIPFPEAFPDFVAARDAAPELSIVPGYDSFRRDFTNLGQASDTAVGWCNDVPAAAVGGPYDAGFEMTGAVAAANDTPPSSMLIVTWERGTNDLATCSGQLPALKALFPDCIRRFRARVRRPLVFLCQTVIDRDTSETPACGEGGVVFDEERADWNAWLLDAGLCDGVIPVGSDPVLGCNGCMTDAAGGPLTADGTHPTLAAARDYMTPYYLTAIESAAFLEDASVPPCALPSPIDLGPGNGGCIPSIASTLPDLASAAGSPPGDLTVTGSCLENAVASVGGIPMACASSTAGTCTGRAPGACLQCTVPACTEAPVCCFLSEGTPDQAGAVAVCNANGCARSTGVYPQQGVQWMQATGLSGLWTPEVVTCAAGHAIELPDHSGGGWTLTPTGAGPLCETGGGSAFDQPYLSSPDALGDYRLQNSLYPGAYVAHEVEIQARREAIVTSFDALLTLGAKEFVLGWGSADGGAPGASNYGVGQYAGQPGYPGNVVSPAMNTDFHLDSLFADAASMQRLNGGAWIGGYTPSGGPLAPFSGITTSGYYANGFVGRLGTFAEYEAPMNKRGQEGWASYFARHGW
jgi:hypothetical protein